MLKLQIIYLTIKHLYGNVNDSKVRLVTEVFSTVPCTRNLPCGSKVSRLNCETGLQLELWNGCCFCHQDQRNALAQCILKVILQEQ